jgi:hypothetical protein
MSPKELAAALRAAADIITQDELRKLMLDTATMLDVAEVPIQWIERDIAIAFIDAVLAAGLQITVDDPDSDGFVLMKSTNKEAILKDMFQSDEDLLLIANPAEEDHFAWCKFVYGNSGWDVISDYTTNLEPYMAKANRLSDLYDH